MSKEELMTELEKHSDGDVAKAVMLSIDDLPKHDFGSKDGII